MLDHLEYESRNFFTPLNLLSLICQNVLQNTFKSSIFKLTFLLIFDSSSICAYRGVPHTPTLRIPLKLQPKPRVLGFFDFFIHGMKKLTFFENSPWYRGNFLLIRFFQMLPILAVGGVEFKMVNLSTL